MRHFGKAAAFAGALACAGPVIAQEHNPFDWRSVPEQDD